MKNFFTITKSKTWLIVIFCNIFFTNNKATAQKVSPPVFRTTKAKTKVNDDTTLNFLSRKFKAFNIVSFPASDISIFLQNNSNRNKAFQLKTQQDLFEIQLTPSNIVSKNFKLTIQEPDGLKETYPTIEDIFYKGFANSNTNNIVRLTIKEGLVSGFIQNNGNEIFIESLSNFIKNANPNDVIIYKTTDIITTGNSSCGVTDRTAFIENAQKQNKIETSTESLVGDCKKLKFTFITDYSMYSFFNGDVLEMQNKLLATLNNAQGVYTKLNFGIDSTTDVGEDELNFEMVHLHITSCKECDIVLPSQEVLNPYATIAIRSWIKNIADTNSTAAFYYWTRRQISQIGTGPVGGISYDKFTTCNQVKLALIVCSYRPEASYLRQVTAHELGHTFDCTHDNVISPAVTNYIMYYAINPNVSAFSTLTDFTGILVNGQPYSSKLRVGNTVRKIYSCLQSCLTNTCLEIKNLKARNFENGDSILVTWEGVSNNFKLRVKEKNNLSASYILSQNVNVHQYVLKGLQKCNVYNIEVINDCGNRASLMFSTSIINAKNIKVTNERANLHDVKMDIDITNALNENVRITVDHKVKWFCAIATSQKIVLKNIFSDGARHRIDIYQGHGIICKNTFFYIAPYFRRDAIVLTSADFKDCKKPTTWKDSIFNKGGLAPFDKNPFWSYKSQYEQILLIPNGTLDSTCMMTFSNDAPAQSNCAGSIGLNTPIIDLSKYNNSLLSFDYKHSFRPSSSRQPVFKVEGFNGEKWVSIFSAEPTRQLTPLNSLTFWDTLPERIFISLDNFKNAKFSVRFVVDDSSFNNQIIKTTFVAIDNIKIDTYLKTDNTPKSIITIFPNPTQNEIFIKSDLQSEQPHSYSILDATGKLIENKKLFNYRINVEKLSSALYFIQFHFKSGIKTESYKFIKQ